MQELTFEKWVKQHNPEQDWNFNDLDKLEQQLINTIRESGSLDIQSIKNKFEILDNSMRDDPQ